MFKTNGKSFTLIELLVVIAIIGVLAALVMPNLREIRAKARDAKRVEDLRQLQNALEMYYSDHQAYPSGNIGSNSQDGFCLERSLNENGSCPSDKFCDLIKPYLARLPRDPLFKWSDTSSPCYFYLTDTNTTSTAQAYKAAAKMEKDFSRAENDGGTNSQWFEISDTGFKGLSLSLSINKTLTLSSQADWDAGTYNNTEGASSPGDVKLAVGTLFEDNFEDGTLNKWQQTTNANINETYVHSGSYSVKQDRTCCLAAPETYCLISNSFTATHDLVFNFWMMNRTGVDGILRQIYYYLWEDANNYVMVKWDSESIYSELMSSTHFLDRLCFSNFLMNQWVIKFDFVN